MIPTVTVQTVAKIGFYLAALGAVVIIGARLIDDLSGAVRRAA
jgi:hypothetical protein